MRRKDGDMELTDEEWERLKVSQDKMHIQQSNIEYALGKIRGEMMKIHKLIKDKEGY